MRTALVISFEGAVRYFPKSSARSKDRRWLVSVKTAGQGVDEGLRWFALDFKSDFYISLMASDLGWADAATVDVFQDVVHMGGELIGADGPPRVRGRGAAATAADDRAETEFLSPTLVSSVNFEGSDLFPKEAASHVVAKHLLWVAARRCRHQHMRRIGITVSRHWAVIYQPTTSRTTNCPTALLSQSSRSSSMRDRRGPWRPSTLPKISSSTSSAVGDESA